MTCFTPTFRPGTQLTVNVGELTADLCPYERPLLVEVVTADGELAYPLAVAIEDLAISVLTLPTGQRATLEVVAIAEQFAIHADEAAYRASGTPMAVESLIPSGLFATAGRSHRGSRCARAC